MSSNIAASGENRMDLPDRGTLLVFCLLVVVGGSNAVAVRLSNLDLAPFWGAATRFGLAALIFWIIFLARRLEIPHGKALVGTIIYGLLSVGLAYAFLYYALVYVTASLTMVTLALVPLLTLMLAILHRLESFRWRGLLGALVALVGILISLSGKLADEAPLGALLALFVGALCMSEASVFYKLIPPVHPVTTNALALTVGSLLLFVISFFAGEIWTMPGNSTTWLAFLYLVFFGSVLLFYIYLYVLSRWTASATSYAFLLFPISTIVIAALVTGEAVNGLFILGSVLVMIGVWIGAISRSANPQTAEKSAAEQV